MLIYFLPKHAQHTSKPHVFSLLYKYTPCCGFTHFCRRTNWIA
jgi:hypothetical protein